ncbi:MAG TPA: aspartate--tRNA(Asn) ligase [Chloroflexota bacterium]|nr:aspartate--tRNA(Asn) ligase [Chloroflexota bacterium]
MTDTVEQVETRTLATDLPQKVGSRARIEGWVHAVRKFGGVNFLIVRDRSGLAQAVLQPEDLAKLEGLQVETVVAVDGTVAEEPRATNGVELRDVSLDVISPVTEVLPFELNKKVLKPSLDVFLNNAPVGLRFPAKQAAFRIYADLLAGFREYLTERGFTEIHSPKLVGTATEGGANVFALDYFGKPAYLVQSPQLYKQIMVGVFERVFEIGPVFRAEEHYTARHLNEYNSLDIEMGFISGPGEVMDVLLGVLEHMVQTAARRHPRDMELLGVEMPRFGNVPRLKFREAQQIILDRFGEDRFAEPDLSPQDERWLGQWASEEHDTDFVFVTHFPTTKAAWYAKADPDDPEYSLGFDLIFRGQELVSGAQRINSYEDLLARLNSRGMNPASFAGYLEAFKYGMPPEGGFAIGSERLLMRLVGADNIRETTLFPRDVNRLEP